MRSAFASCAALALLASLVAACQPLVSTAAYPLYPKVDTGPGPDKVALLRGPIAIVDGQGVAGKGPAFELLPGCHLVALEPAADKPPSVIFAFQMRPAYIYTVSAGADTAQARAPDGSVTPVPRARATDVTACRDWSKSQRF